MSENFVALSTWLRVGTRHHNSFVSHSSQRVFDRNQSYWKKCGFMFWVSSCPVPREVKATRACTLKGPVAPDPGTTTLKPPAPNASYARLNPPIPMQGVTPHSRHGKHDLPSLSRCVRDVNKNRASEKNVQHKWACRFPPEAGQDAFRSAWPFWLSSGPC